jgi:protein O-mannosyl-transferase
MHTSQSHSFLARYLQRPLLHAVLVIVVGIVCYANTFSAPFELDDNRQMLELPFVQNLRYLTDLSLFKQYAAHHDFRLRLVGYLSFAVNYALHGAWVPGFHLVNLAIHLVNALFVYALVRVTFATPFFADACAAAPPDGRRPVCAGPRCNAIALFAALLFVAHPVQTEAVTYIVQRLASLATLFYLASLFLYVRARRAQLDAKGARWWLPYAGSLVCAILAMKTKEISFTLPLALCLYEWMFFRGRAASRIGLLVPFLLTMSIIPLSLLAAPDGGGGATHLGELAKAGNAIGRWDYLVTELRVMVTYLRLLVLPVRQNLIYDYPVFHSLLTPQVLVSLLCLTCLIFLAGYLYRRSGPALTSVRPPLPELRMVAFGIFWFFLTLSVESSLIPINDVIFEHRLYLPSVGAFIAVSTALALAAERLAPRVARGRELILVTALLVVGALTSATLARNAVWGSEESLWRDVTAKSPNKALGHQSLGLVLFAKGEIPQAFAAFDRSLALEPEFAEGYSNRGTLFAQVGNYDRAIADLTKSLELKPDVVEPLSNLGLVYLQLGREDKAIELLRRAIALDPNYVKAYNNLGLALARQGRLAEAIGQYDRAIALLPNYAKAFFNRGVAYGQQQRLDQAVADLSRSIALDPTFGEAYLRRGDLLLQGGGREQAVADFKAACELRDEEGCRRLAGGSAR